MSDTFSGSINHLESLDLPNTQDDVYQSWLKSVKTDPSINLAQRQARCTIPKLASRAVRILLKEAKEKRKEDDLERLPSSLDDPTGMSPLLFDTFLDCTDGQDRYFLDVNDLYEVRRVGG
jgi:hypothetical protein